MQNQATCFGREGPHGKLSRNRYHSTAAALGQAGQFDMPTMGGESREGAKQDVQWHEQQQGDRAGWGSAAGHRGFHEWDHTADEESKTSLRLGQTAGKSDKG